MSKVKLDDVAFERKETHDNADQSLPVVGLEHITPGEITLSNWDKGVETTFTKYFHKGDVLFGRRRAYQKKACVAPFEGICSGDITVIAPKEDKIFPELLPFVIQNDDMFEYAVSQSAGSLSPRVKWGQLKEFAFELPPMEKQKEIADILSAMARTKKAYQRLLTATDEYVKSQFIEMFGMVTKRAPLQDLSDMVTVGIANAATHAYADTGVLMFRNQNIKSNELDDSDLVYIKPEFAKKYASKTLKANDILVARTGYPGTACIVPEKYAGAQTFTTLIVRLKQNPDLLPAFVCHYINSAQGQEYVKQNEGG